MIVSINNAEHYKWGQECDGWHLLKSEGLSVLQENMPPGTSEELHYHQKSQQLFYILSGVAHFIVNGDEFILGANESIHIPSFAKHNISNKSKEDLKFLVISQPKSHGDRINISSEHIK